jgi:predicted AlkP superfamily pyrophosphatase or phosphodiesterase
MKTVLPLFVFVDACGWEIIRDDPFARLIAPHRRRLDSVFGFSSACIPSILSGRLPFEHRNWCYFVYDPEHSPFKNLRALRWIPKAITGRRRFRRWLSILVKARLKFRGYFDLYNIPFRHISLFDFTERKNPLQPKGLNCGPNIFDYLESHGLRYHVSDPALTERGNLDLLSRDVAKEEIDFAFLYWPALDGLLHRVGNDSTDIPEKLRDYERLLDELLAAVRGHYDEVKLYIFSDHGMANCDEIVDLQARVERLGLKIGVDYAVVYDSTMARFWFLNESSRREITACLARVPQGRILPDSELEKYGVLFPDRHFGEMFFLMREGVLIVPSHMGERPIRAMHGYHPRAPHSYASLLTNQPSIPADITGIQDMFKLMVRDAEEAGQRNHTAMGTVGRDSCAEPAAAVPSEAR